MKKTIVFEALLLLFLLVGIAFRIMHWPMAGLISILSITGIMGLFVSHTVRLIKSIFFIVPLTFALILFNALFVLQHWPNPIKEWTSWLMWVIWIGVPLCFWIGYFVSTEKSRSLLFSAIGISAGYGVLILHREIDGFTLSQKFYYAVFTLMFGLLVWLLFSTEKKVLLTYARSVLYMFIVFIFVIPLLSRNTKKDIQNSFVVINNGLEDTKMLLEKEANEAFTALDSSSLDSLQYDTVLMVQRKSNSLIQQIDVLKLHLKDTLANTKGDLLNYTTHYMQNDNRAVNLYESLVSFQNYVHSEPMDSFEVWFEIHFYHLPAVAVITNLSKMQTDILNDQVDYLNHNSK